MRDWKISLVCILFFWKLFIEVMCPTLHEDHFSAASLQQVACWKVSVHLAVKYTWEGRSCVLRTTANSRPRLCHISPLGSACYQTGLRDHCKRTLTSGKIQLPYIGRFICLIKSLMCPSSSHSQVKKSAYLYLHYIGNLAREREGKILKSKVKLKVVNWTPGRKQEWRMTKQVHFPSTRPPESALSAQWCSDPSDRYTAQNLGAWILCTRTISITAFLGQKTAGIDQKAPIQCKNK